METLSYPLDAHKIRTLVREAVPVLESSQREAPLARPCVVALGAFDGVHRGHRALIEACRADARKRGCASVVVTFDPDPSEVVAGAHADLRLLSVNDRVAFCRLLGVDRVVVLRFTQDMAALAPIDFVDMLQERLGCIAAMHVGANFHFGHGGRGSAATLRGIGERGNFDVVAHELLTYEGQAVSSTRIRRFLQEGNIAAAMQLLGRPHFVRGEVAHGRGEGTGFGFPTANVCCDARSCLPAEGVYACLVSDGTSAWPSAVNVGAPPTFSEHRDAFLEANLIGFSGNLYHKRLSVIFLEWLRASRPFSSLDELERVVLGNIAWVRDNMGSEGVEVRP